MNSERAVVDDVTIAVDDRGVVAALGPAAEIRKAYPGASELDATGCLVVPGFVNAHQHVTADPLVASCIPVDAPAGVAIFDWIVPLHARATGDDEELAATIAAVDSLQRGVTTLLEPGTSAHPLRVAKGLAAAGIRGRVGTWGWDTDGLPFARAAREALAVQEEVVTALSGTKPVTGWVTLVGHEFASDELLVGAAELAERLGVGLTWHISPDGRDIPAFLRRSGQRPIQHFRDLGVLGPRVVLGHAGCIDDSELDILIETQTAIAACPAAYLRLERAATRRTRHREFLRRGGRLALGCDSHNAGDAPDVLVAAWLLSALKDDPTVGTAETGAADERRLLGAPLGVDAAFAAATITGAEAVGLGRVIGSIEIGKAADLVVLDPGPLPWSPAADPALRLVWGQSSRSVRDVLVDGKVVVRNGRSVMVDLPALRAEAADRVPALLERAGTTFPRTWPRCTASDFTA